MQSVSSRIWTRVVVSIFYDDNHYTTGTSKYDIWHSLWEGGLILTSTKYCTDVISMGERKKSTKNCARHCTDVISMGERKKSTKNCARHCTDVISMGERKKSTKNCARHLDLPMRISGITDHSSEAKRSDLLIN